MKRFLFFLLILAAVCGGGAFFLVQNQYVIIKLPWFSYPTLESKSSRTSESEREIACQVWVHDHLVNVKKKILWSQDYADLTIKRVISAWLSVGMDEQIIPEDVKISSVALTNQSTVALLSFDKNFIPQQASTHDRWSLVESLLATLRTSGVVLEGVYFLEGQELLRDDYLDFSQRWPIGGYQSQ